MTNKKIFSALPIAAIIGIAILGGCPQAMHHMRMDEECQEKGYRGWTSTGGSQGYCK